VFYRWKIKEKNKSFEETIYRDVERETSIKLERVELLSDPINNDRRNHFYHAKLTDENVNDMKREDGQALDFFTFRELNRLNLSALTKLFVAKHRDLLEQTHIY
jgi:ADP-ribose pyrophosphatase YjhB (NUDIX family)